jgi:hypothetical protein
VLCIHTISSGAKHIGSQVLARFSSKMKEVLSESDESERGASQGYEINAHRISLI